MSRVTFTSNFVEQEFLKYASKFVVEYCVYDGIEEAVHVAEPNKEREQEWINLAGSWIFEEIVVADADGVDDVDGEEWNPTQEKYTWRYETVQGTHPGTSFGGRQGGILSPLILKNNSDFWVFVHKMLFFTYFAPPPRKSVKILRPPGNTEMTSLHTPLK